MRMFVVKRRPEAISSVELGDPVERKTAWHKRFEDETEKLCLSLEENREELEKREHRKCPVGENC